MTDQPQNSRATPGPHAGFAQKEKKTCEFGAVPRLPAYSEEHKGIISKAAPPTTSGAAAADRRREGGLSLQEWARGSELHLHYGCVFGA